MEVQQYTSKSEAKVFNAASAGTENAEAALSITRDSMMSFVLVSYVTRAIAELPIRTLSQKRMSDIP